jgi:hypothetical protein
MNFAKTLDKTKNRVHNYTKQRSFRIMNKLVISGAYYYYLYSMES